MQQRTLGRTGIQVGEIGMGCEGFMGKTAEQVMEMVDVMDAAGVSCIDLYTPNPDVRDSLGLGGHWLVHGYGLLGEDGLGRILLRQGYALDRARLCPVHDQMGVFLGFGCCFVVVQ